MEISPQLPASVAAATGQSVGSMLAGRAASASFAWVSVNGTGTPRGQNNMSQVEDTPQQESRPDNDMTKYFFNPTCGTTAYHWHENSERSRKEWTLAIPACDS